MRSIYITLFLLIAGALWCSDSGFVFYEDSDTNYYYMPSGPIAEKVPVLVYLSCTGGLPEHIDSVMTVADSLGWAIAVCKHSKNHRHMLLNEIDILNLIARLEDSGKINPYKIAVFGFSGQGVGAWGTALRHPSLIDAVITQCAHSGGITTFNAKASHEQLFHITTRYEDWNYDHNIMVHKNLQAFGIRDTLVINEGEHDIEPHIEVYKASEWVNNKYNSEKWRSFYGR